MRFFVFILAGVSLLASGCVSQTGYGEIARNPKAGELNMRLGLAYLQQGAYEQANAKLGRALKQAPRSADINWAYAVLQESIERPQRARKYYSKALDISPNAPDILNSYGTFLCKQGDTSTAFLTFEKVAQNKLYSTPEIALTNAGVCALTVNDPIRAETYFRRALSANSKYASALYQMSLLAFQDGRYLASRAHRERLKAVLSRPDPKVLYLCARTEERLDNRVEAARCARKLKSDFPSSEEARAIF